MQKLILILLAFLALFTIISAFEGVEASAGNFAENSETSISETNVSLEKSPEPVEIVQ